MSPVVACPLEECMVECVERQKPYVSWYRYMASHCVQMISIHLLSLTHQQPNARETTSQKSFDDRAPARSWLRCPYARAAREATPSRPQVPPTVLQRLRSRQSLLPPFIKKAFRSGVKVAIQNSIARPGHDAALRPNSPMYQFVHLPENTLSRSRIWMSLVVRFSTDSFTAIDHARWFRSGFTRARAV